MEEYQLSLNSMPEVTFAHWFGTDEYDIHHTICDNIIEVAYILQGESHIETEGREFVAPANSTVISIYDREHRYFSEGYHQHVTAAFQVSFSHVKTGGLILPQIFPFKSADNPVRPLLEQLVLQYNTDPHSSQVTALLLTLLGTLSSLYLADKKTREQNFGQEWYVSRAKSYIANNISSPIRVTDVARHLDISAGHLSHIFSAETGQTLIQYINTVRLNRVEELVLTYGMSIRQAGEQVGLNDPNYASRLYRRKRGFSLSELRHSRVTMSKKENE